MSPTTGKGYMIASINSYDDALNGALEGCRNQGVYDCIIHTRGNTYVYNPPTEEDRNIVKAQNTCRKVGYTPDTQAFADCTIKVLSSVNQGQGQGQGQTIILRRKYPKVACDAMGGLVC